MKVLHVISSGGLYGAEAVILDLCRGMQLAGQEAAVANFANSAHPNTELEERARQQGLASYALPCHGQLDRSVPARLRRLVAEQGFSLVHAHGYKADVYAYWAMRGSRVPLVSTCHNWIDSNLNLRAYGALDRFLLRRFAAVVAVSKAVQDRLLGAGVSASRCFLVGNGVDVAPYATLGRDLSAAGADWFPNIGLVGRLSHEKGVDLFIEAASRVLKAVPNASFAVFGDGPERPALEALVSLHSLQGRVVLAGRQDDMPAVYGALDLLVLTSRMEGLPVALLEGMASGLPVVATAVGDVPKVVRDGETGLLVPAGDVPAIAAAITRLARDPGLCTAMGEAGKRRVELEFSGDRMTADYMEIYNMTLAAPPAG